MKKNEVLRRTHKKEKIIPRETINKAIDYILLHLTAQISVDDVADF